MLECQLIETPTKQNQCLQELSNHVLTDKDRYKG